MSIDRRIGSKPAEFSQRDRATVRLDTGPYIGIIKNNLDPLRKGRLQVYIPDFGGDENLEQNWTTVNYASPFIGSTFQNIDPDTQSASRSTSVQAVNHTYGMWFVPPDLGNQVLVTFVAGDPNRGYWFACISPHASHNMIPGVSSTTKWSDDEPRRELPGDIEKQVVTGNQYPTLEFNENDPAKRQPGYINNNPRPLHQVQFRRLVEQGLENDPVRGTHTSSSQREVPSSVFGISTPGQPAWDESYRKSVVEKVKKGTATEDDFRVTARQGGHTFIMDDGTLEGDNQMVKLRTSGGHQILMHDSAKTMYISNSTGSVWIELNDSGNLHIYSGSGLNIRSGGDINLHSDSNININAGGNLNIKARNQIKTESEELHASTKNNTKLYSTNIEMLADQEIKAKATGILLNSGPAPAKPNPLTVYELTDSKFDANKQVWAPEEKALTSVANIVPTHEPYARKTGVPIEGGSSSSIDTKSSAKTSLSTSFKGTTGFDLTTESGSVVTDGSGNPIGVGGSPGPASAVGKPINKKLAPSAMTTQPSPPGGIGSLSASDVRAVMAQLGFRESSNNYSAINQLGYLGKYQFGAAALVDRGYIKSGAFATYGQGALTRPESWTGKDGIKNRDDFLRNTQIQESVMFEQLTANYNTLVRTNAISSGNEKTEIAGMLSVSHLLGPGGANTWKKTGTGSDANGVGGGEYYNLGRYSIEVLSKGA